MAWPLGEGSIGFGLPDGPSLPTHPTPLSRRPRTRLLRPRGAVLTEHPSAVDEFFRETAPARPQQTGDGRHQLSSHQSDHRPQDGRSDLRGDDGHGWGIGVTRALGRSHLRAARAQVLRQGEADRDLRREGQVVASATGRAGGLQPCGRCSATRSPQSGCSTDRRTEPRAATGAHGSWRGRPTCSAARGGRSRPLPAQFVSLAPTSSAPGVWCESAGCRGRTCARWPPWNIRLVRLPAARGTRPAPSSASRASASRRTHRPPAARARAPLQPVLHARVLGPSSALEHVAQRLPAHPQGGKSRRRSAAGLSESRP